jgi:hypothetical protein
MGILNHSEQNYIAKKLFFWSKELGAAALSRCEFGLWSHQQKRPRNLHIHGYIIKNKIKFLPPLSFTFAPLMSSSWAIFVCPSSAA